MTLTLKPPVRPISQLKALAASGASGLAKAAQEEIKRRTNEALRRAVHGPFLDSAP